jgi:hypothetical protein
MNGFNRVVLTIVKGLASGRTSVEMFLIACALI